MLVIGLDYGTTFTGVAFCENSDIGIVGKEIIVVKDYPHRFTKIGTKEKIPSEIALHDRSLWGALIPPNTQRYMWTKLLLDHRKAGEVEKILTELARDDAPTVSTDPVEIISDFLAHVKNHLIKNLEIHYGKELWKTMPITLMVTVPAVWSDAAKDATLRAVRKGGFNSTELPQLKTTALTTEPEAAAIYTIQSLHGGVQDKNFAIDDGFIVCDMGGGTVDLISYRIAGLQPIMLEEASVGSGHQCGGSFVERGFLKWLESRLGTKDFFSLAGTTSNDLPRTSLSPKLSRMVNDFVLEAKSGFTGSETNFLRLPAPLSSIEDDKARGIQDGEIKITSGDMKVMFGFSIRRTYELLGAQIQQLQSNRKLQLKYVFMVGGFSESAYVYDMIKAFAEGYGLQVIRPAHAWSAIVRGAAAKGLEGSRTPIMVRKCRRHYGTDCTELFTSSRHRKYDSYVCSYTGNLRASNQMHWFLKKGQNLSTATESHAQYTLFLNMWPHESRELTVHLFATDADKAPSRLHEQGIYKVAELTADLSSVPPNTFREKKSPAGRLFYRLYFELEISVQSSLEYSLLVDGVRYATVSAKYT